MKKILVIMIMVLLCSTSVMAQAKKRSARKPKAKVERQMTDFEKWQKEEKLAYYLSLCKEYYDGAKTMESRGHSNKSLIETRYRMAENYQKLYEDLEKSNYYVDLHSYSQKYYNGGEIINIHVNLDGGAEYIGGMHDTEEDKALADELVRRINQEIGYDKEKVINDRKNKVGDFLNQYQSKM